jgi:sugar-specific transcriptional regulator TrmB/DNA-binding CsgD family transcriptional regulator
MLEILGLDQVSEAAYFAVLDSPQLSLDELAARTGTDAQLLTGVLHRLADRGLIASLPDRPVRYTALPPEHAIEVLLLASERDIQRVRSLAPRLTEQHRQALAAQDSASLIEVITGAAAVARCGQQLFRRADKEIRGIDAPPYAQSSDGQRVNSSVAIGAERDRVRIRFIHGRAELDEAGTAARVEADIAAGEEVRFLPTAPLKMIIADDQAALIPLVTTPQVLDSCILVRPSSLLDALCTLFETLWAQAQPYLPDQAGRADGNRFVSEEERRIISLLGVGLSDEAIARQLGIGYRTVQRRVQAVLARLGAASRFQAGVLAASQGWWNPHAGPRPAAGVAERDGDRRGDGARAGDAGGAARIVGEPPPTEVTGRS